MNVSGKPTTLALALTWLFWPTQADAQEVTVGNYSCVPFEHSVSFQATSGVLASSFECSGGSGMVVDTCGIASNEIAAVAAGLDCTPGPFVRDGASVSFDFICSGRRAAMVEVLDAICRAL